MCIYFYFARNHHSNRLFNFRISKLKVANFDSVLVFMWKTILCSGLHADNSFLDKLETLWSDFDAIHIYGNAK